MNVIKNRVLDQLKNGNRLLNTNIPESIVKAAGLKEDQYVKPTVRNSIRNNF
jgi:antitoxin component of MazEF toxin-antitoxin module